MPNTLFWLGEIKPIASRALPCKPVARNAKQAFSMIFILFYFGLKNGTSRAKQ